MFDSDYFKVNKNGISQAQTMAAYLGGSAFQTVIDNPVTAYRQHIQQYAKNAEGKMVDPKVARFEANKVFMKNPISVSLSGLVPRLVGVGFKRVPKFGFLLGISFFINEHDGKVGMVAATGASIFSAPFINPIRMIEKQQRAHYKTTGKEKPILEIIKESQQQNFKPLFRGTIPLMGHSLASATTGLVGQPQLQKWIQHKLLNSNSGVSQSGANLISSAMVSPIYVLMTNPLSRLEVIMQTNDIKGKRISLTDAVKELAKDSKEHGLRGAFRGQGIGILKAVISLTLFHEGRMWCTDAFKKYNVKNNKI